LKYTLLVFKVLKWMYISAMKIVLIITCLYYTNYANVYYAVYVYSDCSEEFLLTILKIPNWHSYNYIPV